MMSKFSSKLLLFLTAIIQCASGQGLAQIRFKSVSNSVGFSHSTTNVSTWGAGVSYFDINEDGWDDITIVGERVNSLVIWTNENGAFKPMFTNINLSGFGIPKQPLWLDYDNDGDNDLIVTMRDSNALLFRNEGNFFFTDVTEEINLDTTAGLYYGVSAADLDRNGFLDIYVTKYDENESNFTNIFYLNNQGVLTDFTVQAGLADSNRHSFGSVMADFNNDTLLDIYVINDLSSENNLYINNGDSTFYRDTSTVLKFMMNGMGADITDLNDDDYPDVFITNTRPINVLFLSDTAGQYTEFADTLNVDTTYISWGCNLFDADHDLDQDAAVMSGVFSHVLRPIINLFYENIGTPSMPNYALDTAAIGTGIYPSFGSAIGDFNNDRMYDLAINNSWPATGELRQNITELHGSALTLTLVGTESNRNAFGSVITAYTGVNKTKYYSMASRSYLSQNSQNMIISTRDSCGLDSLNVLWPSGEDTTLHNVACNQSIKLYERGLAFPFPVILAPHGAVICGNDSVLLHINGHYSSVQWSNGFQGDSIWVTDQESISVVVGNQFGHQASSHAIEVIERPLPNFSFQAKNPKCHGLINGSVEVVHGAESQGPWLYEWSNGSDVQKISKLEEGLYSVTVTDGHKCANSSSAELIEPSTIVLQSEVIDASCFESLDGSIKVTPNGGTMPYSYTWSNSKFTAANGDIGAGTYMVTVSDINGCDSIREFTVHAPEALSAESNTYLLEPDSSSWGVTIAADGGSPPYQFLWSHGRNLNDSVAEGLAPGKYTVTVADYNGCTDTVTFELAGLDTIVGYSSLSNMNEIVWWPNPNSEGIIYASRTVLQVKIYSATGLLLGDFKEVSKIDIGRLPSGYYFLETTQNGIKQTQKLAVLQR